MANEKLELLRMLLTQATNSSANSTNTTATVFQCQFFDLAGYMTQATLAFVSFSVLVGK